MTKTNECPVCSGKMEKARNSGGMTFYRCQECSLKLYYGEEKYTDVCIDHHHKALEVWAAMSEMGVHGLYDYVVNSDYSTLVYASDFGCVQVSPCGPRDILLCDINKADHLYRAYDYECFTSCETEALEHKYNFDREKFCESTDGGKWSYEDRAKSVRLEKIKKSWDDIRIKAVENAVKWYAERAIAIEGISKGNDAVAIILRDGDNIMRAWMFSGEDNATDAANAKQVLSSLIKHINPAATKQEDVDAAYKDSYYGFNEYHIDIVRGEQVKELPNVNS